MLDRDPSTITRRIDGLSPDALATVLHPQHDDATPDGERCTHAAWVQDGGAIDGAAESLRHLSAPLERREGHLLLAAQLVHGFAVCVDAREVRGE